MNRPCKKTDWKRRAGITALLIGLSSAAYAQDFDLDWWTIDSGGTVSSQAGEWTLQGTLGQWDASPQGLSNGDWLLEGGFWPFDEAAQDDGLFSDRFELTPASTVTRTDAN